MGSKKRCRFSRIVSLGSPHQGWWWVPSTSVACPTGRPANPAIHQHSWQKAQVDNPPYLQCLGRPGAPPEDVLFPTFGQMGEPHHYLPGVFQKNVPGVLYRAFPWVPALLLVPERLLSSLPCFCSGTSGIYPRIDSMSSYCCKCGVGGIRHPLPPDLASWCYIPTCGQPPVSAGEPLWPFGGPHHVGLPSSWA